FDTPLPYELPEPAEHAPPPPAAAFAYEIGLGAGKDMLLPAGANARPAAEARGGITEDPLATSALLTALGFNPNTDPYVNTAGERVFVDNRRTIHILPDGTAIYGDASVLSQDTDEESGERTELDSVRIALGAVPQGEAFWGEGRLCLRAVEQTDSGLMLTLAYELNGAFVDGGESVFVVRGGRLSEARIQPRPLYALPQTRDMLPQRQAAVLLPPGSRLAPAYRYDEESGVYLPYWMYY
ncbi:MAG: hypothetical protein FWH06_04295, partial [Oscillospiraceae bacterium]|nr:hypothetical protein [Oscillospiraceae bacterium]